MTMRTLLPLLVLIAGCASVPAPVEPGLTFGKAFWDTWGDGRAELAGYELEFPRYGEIREGTAVLIFVTEPFTVDPRVKADGPNAKRGDVFQVMKLNLVRDFPTGIYDYNTMTSTFVGLEPFAGLPAGATAKVTFSSQEWCGQVWEQLVFHPRQIEIVSHSYFGAEADQAATIERQESLWTEDQLFHWARGFALPGAAEEQVRMLPTLLEARLTHQPLEPRRVDLRKGLRQETIEVPAGTFESTVHQATAAGGTTWTFWIETAPPHRIIKWTTSTGETARLKGSARLPYWQMNDSNHRQALEQIGLEPRTGYP